MRHLMFTQIRVIVPLFALPGVAARSIF